MNSRSVQPKRDTDVLSKALKMVRRHRGMTAAAVATAMRIPLRTYERFEAGGSRLNIDYVHRFAAATNSDPHAIILGVLIGSPELARRSADNKLVTTLAIGGQRLNNMLGDGIAHLDARAIIVAVCTMYDDLLAESDRQQIAARWLEKGVTDLSRARPKPGR